MERNSLLLPGEGPTQPSAGLLKLGAAAKRAGVSRAVLIHAASRGQIPIEVIQLGRGLYVNGAALEAWLSSKRAPK